jgi:murein DD-endopeptidase MepM/ murein hydrolase activator NlpD
MVRLLILCMVPLLLWSAKMEELKWEGGETYLQFLERHGLPQKPLYYDLDKEDQKVTEEILTGVGYQMLRDDNATIEQVLIPLNDELQLHIYRDSTDAYAFEAIPIISETKRHAFVLDIENSPYYDIINATGSTRVAQAFITGFKNSLNFRTDLRKGDPLAMVYERKYRMGKPFSEPKLLAAMIEMRKKRHYVFLNSDDRYYDENGREVEGFMLANPVPGSRISSRFTKRRFHPVLKRYRAHLGVDYAARSGTPIRAAGSGRVIYAGYTRGYGKVIKIRHSDGYMTLYAHQKSFRRGIRSGVRVKRGQVIGYVGSTGLSTGPHLHFGLYKNGRPINPLRVVRVTNKKLSGEAKRAFEVTKQNLIDELNLYIAAKQPPHKYAFVESFCYVDMQTCQQIPYEEDAPNEAL